MSGWPGTLRGMEEVTIVGSVDADIAADLDRLAENAAITPAEPVEAVYVRQDGQQGRRFVAVHAFTGAGTPLVLGKRGLVPAWEAAGSGESFDHIQPRGAGHGPAVGPFTPAPPGMVAKFEDSMLPVLYFDLYGRPVVIDNDPHSAELYLAAEDSGLQGITGLPIAIPPPL